MVSFDHEMLVDLFRKQGMLAVELLRACAHIKLDHDSVTHDSICLRSRLPATSPMLWSCYATALLGR